MPYLKLATNVDMDQDSARRLCEELTDLASRLLGKPKTYVMAHVEPGRALTFAGTHEPAAFLELKSIGLNAAACGEYSKALCAFVQDKLSASPDRVFIEFKAADGKLFGWNSGTF